MLAVVTGSGFQIWGRLSLLSHKNLKAVISLVLQASESLHTDSKSKESLLLAVLVSPETTSLPSNGSVSSAICSTVLTPAA
jgi:hypothetical protein